MSENRSRIDPARLVAFDVIRDVHADDAYSNLVLPAAIDKAGLFGRDAGFATELTYGTLRRQGSLDAVIAHGAARDDIDPKVMDVLRLGAYQLLFMRVPTHAAVSETVNLAHKVVGAGPAKFVNAVMRRVSERSWEEWVAELTEGLSPVDALAIEYSYPTWVIRALASAYAIPVAELAPLLDSGNAPARVTLVAKPSQCTVEELQAEAEGEPGQWSPLAITLPSGKPGDLSLIQSARAGVQDEGSQLVGLTLAAIPVGGEEAKWLDLCAGPGGKAALLAGLAAQRDLEFVAIEPAPARALLVKKSLRHLSGHIDVLETDARDFNEDGFDRILIDAPCTGLGALRRRPESRWRRQPSDVPPLTGLQSELLAHAAHLVRVGGIIGYATCSPHLAETDVIVATFLRNHKNFELVPVGPYVPGNAINADDEFMRLRSDIHGTDGMFMAVVRRTS